MVYIYKKVIHGKPYYYLRISRRVKGKIIVKDIAYLGNNALELEEKLKKLPSYNSEIREAYRNIKKFIQGEYYLKKARELELKDNPYLNKNFLEEIEAIRLHFNGHFLRQDKKIIDEAYKNFLIDFAFNTASLEGNTITLAEASKLLRENLTPKNRTLREIYDLQNTEKVFFGIISPNREIGHDFIAWIHDKLMENIDNRKGYRQHDIRVFKSNFEVTPFPYIKADIEILLKWHKEHEHRLHPLVLAGIFHQKFEKIHPFSDGNGRTGRMIVSYMLMKKNYPPLIIKKSKRASYLDTLALGNEADLNSVEPKYYKDLIEYLAEELISTYWSNFNV
ncbi:Fic family protein [Candidatus Woesearchaeota archaeon]|nr:Fic family protein [Candidatus Woesearchaeota archaeon]